MKPFIEDRELKDMTVPTVRPSHHEANLRRVLVSRAAQKAANKHLTLQGVIKRMSKQNIIAGTGIAGMLVIAGLAFSAVGPTKNVSALQLAKDTSQSLSQMTPQKADYQKFYPTFVDWMNQAQKAPDLQVLTYEQLIKSYPNAAEVSPTSGEPLRVIDDSSDGKSPNVRELKYLAFTVTEGDAKYKAIVGINEQNIPEAALKHILEAGKSQLGA